MNLHEATEKLLVVIGNPEVVGNTKSHLRELAKAVADVKAALAEKPESAAWLVKATNPRLPGPLADTAPLGPEPAKWTDTDGTVVYRDYEAYCMD
jgi:hypothetical protein